jgi:hypothetical protein
MPATSQAQARFFRAVASGSVKKKGLAPDKAKEMVTGFPTRGLPEEVGGTMEPKTKGGAMLKAMMMAQAKGRPKHKKKSKHSAAAARFLAMKQKGGFPGVATPFGAKK